MTAVRERWAERMATVAAVAVPFVLYVKTMAPTVYGLDSAELAAGAYVLGIVHAPGAPTFLLVAHAFTWLPFGDVGYRVNLVSATSAAVALGFLFAVLRRLEVPRAAALTGCWWLATTYYYWISALAAELYAPHVCFLAALLWLALRFREQGRPRDLIAFAGLFGLALGNHLAIAFALPGLQVLLLGSPRPPWRDVRLAATAAVALLAGASVYAYLPLRAAAGVGMNYALERGVDVTTADGFAWMLSGRMFEQQLFAIPLIELPREVGWFAFRLWSNFFGLACALGIVGGLAGLRRRRLDDIAIALLLVGHLAFVLTYDVADKELMLLPAFFAWGIWSVRGAVVACAQAGVRSWAAGLLLALALGSFAINLGAADASDDDSARERGEALLAFLPDDALYLGDWGDASVVEYLQRVEAERPDVTLLNAFLVRGSARRRRIAEHLAGGGAAFASATLGPALPPWGSETIAACACRRIRPRGTVEPWSGPPGPDVRAPDLGAGAASGISLRGGSAQ